MPVRKVVTKEVHSFGASTMYGFHHQMVKD